MASAPDSLRKIAPSLSDVGAADVLMDRQPMKSEGGEESAAGVDRLADVLSPLDQILLAADQQLGAIRGRVDLEAGRDSERTQRRVREATLEQRHRVTLMRAELTDRASALAARFEEMLSLLDQAERYLAIRAQSLEGGDASGAVKVTLTERKRLTLAHEGGREDLEQAAAALTGSVPEGAPALEQATAESAGPVWQAAEAIAEQPSELASEASDPIAADPPAPEPAQPAFEPSLPPVPEPTQETQGGIRGWWRRLTRSAA